MEQSPGTEAALRQELDRLEQAHQALQAELAERSQALAEARATLARSAAYNKRVYQDAPVPIVIIDPAVLEALPDELRNTACLCPRCAQVDEQLRGAKQP